MKKIIVAVIIVAVGILAAILRVISKTKEAIANGELSKERWEKLLHQILGISLKNFRPYGSIKEIM